MLNKVVHTLSRALNDLQIPAVRFNFRGVGASEGAYADGVGETEDVLAVAAWAQRRFPGRRPVAGRLLVRRRGGHPGRPCEPVPRS